jgi:hypothetical protein
VAGILDSKSRVIDFALTPQGRRQLSAGKLVFVKATVSDRASFYERDENGATDATQRIYFETYSSPVDQVTLETDDSGALIPYGGKNLEFSSLAGGVAETSGDHFKSLKVLLSDDPDDNQNTQFTVSGRDFVFYPTVADVGRPSIAGIDEIESLLFDKRLSRKKNFMFLPPENEDGSRLGYYQDVRQSLLDDAVSSVMTGKKGTKYQTFVTKFVDTSRTNNLNIQVFQENNGSSGIIKLDLIDFGQATFGQRSGRVIFAGRIYNNSFDFPVFVNILTLVLT